MGKYLGKEVLFVGQRHNSEGWAWTVKHNKNSKYNLQEKERRHQKVIEI